MNRLALVTAREVELVLPSVSRHLVYLWRDQGRLTAHGKRGRSPLYRWGDIIDVERDTRRADPAGQRRSQLVAA